jgi:signal transduction histidine kinase
MYEPTGAHGHLYGSVAISPLRMLTDEERRQPQSALDHRLQQAREADDAAGVCRLSCALFDYDLERGRLADARTYLFEAEVMAMARKLSEHARVVEQRAAWLDYLCAAPGALERLERALQAARAEGGPLEQARTAIYVALVRARSGRRDGLHPMISGAQAQLRSLDDLEPLARLSLLAAMAYQVAGEHDLATIEALRVKAYASQTDDRRLLTAASAILATLGEEGATDRRVHHLISVAIEVGRQRKLSDVLRSVVTSTAELLDADRAFVIRRTPEGARVVAAHARHGPPGEPSASIVAEAIEHGEEVITADIGDSALGAAASVMSLGVRTALCVPMMDGPRVIGAIYADSAQATAGSLADAAWLVRAFAAHAVAAVRNAEHLQQTERRMLRAREMNHDVRNLVSSLRMGLAELRDDVPLEPWARELVEQLHSVSDLIRAEVEASLGDGADPTEELDLGELVEHVVAFMRFDGAPKQVSFDVQTVPVIVRATRGGLTRVVSNLMGNALKYAPEGSVVDVRVMVDARGAKLQVRDRGRGLPSGSEEAIFESGVQAEGHVEGHGLGLGICKRLVREAGGSIRASHHPAGGALFEVRLPVV